MRQPHDKERVVCPITNEKMRPESCWDSIGPNGKPITYGMIPKAHKNKKVVGGYTTTEEDCEWAGLPAPQPVEVV